MSGEDVWKREPVESPCVNTCVIHPQSRICVGCYRSIDEITGWMKYSAQERRALMATLPDRADLVKGSRTGARQRRNKRRPE